MRWLKLVGKDSSIDLCTSNLDAFKRLCCTPLVASAAEYKLFHTETVHNYAFVVHVTSLAKPIFLTLRSHDAVIPFYYFTEVRSLQKHIGNGSR